MAALAAVATVGLGGLTASHITAAAASPTLTGSTFEGGDGNLTVDNTTPGATDWANVAGLNTGIDQNSGMTDNAFGQGTKEDNPAVTVVNGSIPPNKSDLTRFYEASEFANGSNFLYLAWERSNVLGSANMDFEINQNPTTGLTGSFSGPITLNRTAGDMLVTYDFTNGGANPVLGLLRWVTSGSTSQCFSSSSLPCWGNHTTLNSTDSEGAINTSTVTDPISGATLPASTFGEAAINLTAAGVFPAGTCTAFGSAFLKSRSSTSFTAEVKDFVAPIGVSISNCGTITIHKVTVNGDGVFPFSATGGLSPASFNLSNGGMKSFTDVPAGSYSVSEGTEPSGWTLQKLACDTVTGTGTSATPSGATVQIMMNAGGVVDCTYTNHQMFSPTMTTAPQLIPNDRATISGATTTAGGTVTFSLFSPSDSTCGSTPAYTEKVDVSGNGTYTTTNSAYVASQAGTWRWKVVYSGDSNNVGTTSDCGTEQFTIVAG
jgi:hypothetical protein